VLHVDQPKVSALLRGRLPGFSTERLLKFLRCSAATVDIRRPSSTVGEGSGAGAPEDRYTITSAPEELGGNGVTLSVPSTDTADSMLDAIWRFAFPNLTKAIEENDLKLTDQQVKRYALKDLDVLAQSDWQRAQRDRSTDPDAKIARDMGGILRRRRRDLRSPSEGGFNRACEAIEAKG
jgi:hypothetical protein